MNAIDCREMQSQSKAYIPEGQRESRRAVALLPARAALTGIRVPQVPILGPGISDLKPAAGVYRTGGSWPAMVSAAAEQTG